MSSPYHLISASVAVETLQKKIAQTLELLQSKPHKASVIASKLEAIIKDDAFSQLEEAMRNEIYLSYITVLDRISNWDKAIAAIETIMPVVESAGLAFDVKALSEESAELLKSVATTAEQLTEAQIQGDKDIDLSPSEVVAKLDAARYPLMYMRLATLHGDMLRKKARTQGSECYFLASKVYDDAYIEAKKDLKDVEQTEGYGEYIFRLCLLLENKVWADQSLFKKEPTEERQLKVAAAKQRFDAETLTLYNANQQDPWVGLIRGKCLFLLENYEEAAAVCENAIEQLTEKHKPELRQKLYLQCALSIMNTSQMRNTQTLQETIVEPQALAKATKLHEEALGHLELAVKELGFATRNILKAKARILMRLGQFDGVIKAVEANIEKDDVPMQILYLAALFHKLKTVDKGSLEGKGFIANFLATYGELKARLTDSAEYHDTRNALQLAFEMEAITSTAPIAPQQEEELSKLLSKLTEFAELVQKSSIDVDAPKASSSMASSFTSFGRSTSSSGEKVFAKKLSIKSDDLESFKESLERLKTLLEAKDASLISYLKQHVIASEGASTSLMDLLFNLHQCMERLNAYEHKALRATYKQVYTLLEDTVWKDSKAALPRLSLYEAAQKLDPHVRGKLPDLSYRPKCEGLSGHYVRMTNDKPSDVRSRPPSNDLYKPEYGVLSFYRYTDCANSNILRAVEKFGENLCEIGNKAIGDRTRTQQALLETWESDVQQMFLGNPNLPCPYELYAAISRLSSSFFRGTQGTSIMESMEHIQKSMIDSGLILEPGQSLKDYGDLALRTRGTQQAGDEFYTLEAKPYQGSGYSGSRTYNPAPTPSYSFDDSGN